MIFIKGNHDRNNSLKTPIEKLVIRYGGQRICLVHNPLHADSTYPLNFVGHVHEKWKIKRLNENSIMVNVGVDVWNFKPVSYEEIWSAIQRWKKTEQV
jgi:calcineurin-like phosphoesterase family protein